MGYGLLFLSLAFTIAAVRAGTTATYDYIVVGSGPGGGPLACDLARAGYSTLLLEAGDDQGDNPVYANLFNFLEAGSDTHSRWDFWVKHSDDPARELKYEHTTWQLSNGSYYIGLEPPAGAKRLGIQYPRAATLGGCAMHNAGVCSLPQDDDWNAIVNKTGDTSWEAEKMRKYLLKIEKNSYLPVGTAGHGFDGRWYFILAVKNKAANCYRMVVYID
jgi:choline dehydrogenase